MAAHDSDDPQDSEPWENSEPGDASNAGATVREGGEVLKPRTISTRVAVRKLERGEAIGRYLVLDVVGQGGMGVVYAAYDPELDRRVAIKLLQVTHAGGARRQAGARSDAEGVAQVDGSHGDQAWLVREAQAMARLQHPNVLAVHDVGVLGGDRVFVAMELVDGTTLRTWLRAAKRTWREVLPVMRAAGAGLAAAHAAGLVHRDFKPDNVVVGKDGRARVMDFGLARLRAEAGEPAAASRDSDPALAATNAAASLSMRSPLADDGDGTIAGTPAYMAPELYRGAQADARSDQFAFGVALYEALYRARPYDKRQLADPSTTPVLRQAPAADVPAPIARAVLRALAVDPSARYGSMDALLGELVDEPRRSRLALGVAAAAVAIAGALALGAATRTRDGADPPRDPCADAASRLAGIWDDPVRAATRDAFAATRSPLAADSYARVARELDRYAAAWTDAAVDSCRATRVRGEQPEDAMVLRAACLDERRADLRAFAALLGKADAGIVEKAGTAAAALAPIDRCADVAALRAPGTPPADVRPRLDELRGELAAAKAALLGGKTAPALAAATAAADHARAIAWPPAIAEAELLHGLVLQSANRAADAQPALAEAAWAALRGRRDDLVVEAALWAAQNAADGLGKDGEARIWLAMANAVATRVGDRGLAERALEVAGIVAGARGDYAAARDAHDKALAAATALADPARIASAENALAATHAKAGEFVAAAPHYEHALALREAAVGKDHPDVALILSNLGACYDHAGEPAKARAALTRALAIREAAFGTSSPRLLATLNNLADLERRAGEAAAALATIERAYAIAQVAPGSAHPMFHIVATTRGEALLAAGKLADARAAFDQVIAQEDQAKSPVLPTTLTSRAELALAEHAWKDAAGFDERAIALVEATGGKDATDLWRPLAGLARARAGSGDAAGAKAAARRAVEIGRAAKVSDAELGEAVALAR